MTYAGTSLRRYVRSASDGPFGSALKSEHYVDAGARVIRLGNVGAAEWKDSDEAFVTLEYWTALRRHHAVAGDLIVAGLGDEGHPVGRACVLPDVGPALVKADCFRLSLDRDEADARFLAWYLSSQIGLAASEMAAEGSTRQRLTLGKALSLRVPLLSSHLQRAIADYLDAETARIDALIARKRRMIELLEEQALSRAVRLVLGDVDETRGLASPSGLYRHVPDGWGETPLRHLNCHVQTGPFGSQLHAEDYVEGAWPVVNPMNIVDGEIRAVDSMTVADQKKAELLRHVLQPGDIVFARRGEMGRAGLVTSTQAGWLCGTGSLRLRLARGLLVPEYLKLLLGTPAAKAYFEFASVGSTMDNLNGEIVQAFPTLVPPLQTQIEVVTAIREGRGLSNATAVRLSKQIELLREHRQALITAIVTGELSISGVAA